MGNKKSKQAMKILLLIISAVFIVSASLFVASVTGKLHPENATAFEKKVVFNLSDKVTGGSENSQTDDSDSRVGVVLQFSETFTCNHTSIDTFDEVLEHREELKKYYAARNRDLTLSLNLTDCTEVTYSDYGPYIEYTYETAEDFLLNDYAALKSADSVYLEKVYVDEYSVADWSARNEASGSTYNFSKALRDIGIPEDKPFTGNGIKIGIVESGVPENFSNLGGVKYEIYGTTTTSHSFQTSSVLGANSGIANDASLYFAALSDYSFMECCNWFLEKGVNIINRSNGGATGTYNSYSAYADYLVKETKLTFINSAGNDGDTDKSGWPGTGVNVISVASNDANLAVSYFSSAGVQGSCTNSLVNPTVTAPGGKLTGIANISSSISGTSFSAPMTTGVVALLMEEFPILKAHPEQVMSLLTNTCTKAAGQEDIYDHDAGFGIINYTRAREYFTNPILYEISGKASAGYTLYRHYFTLPFGGTVNVKNTLLFNSKQANAGGSLTNLNYSNIKLAIMNNDTGDIITYGDTLSNFSYISFKNETHLGSAPTTNFSFCISIKSSKSSSESEYCSLHYYTDEPTESVGVVHSDGYYVGNGGRVTADFSYEVFEAGCGVRNVYYKTPSSTTYRQYTANTVISAASGDGIYSFYFVDGNGNQSDIYSVNLEMSCLTVGIYRNGSYVFGNTGTDTATLDTKAVFKVGDKLRITGISPRDSFICNYALNTEITVTEALGGDTCSIRFTSSDGKTRTFIIHIIHDLPKLIINGTSYNSGTTLRFKENKTFGWSFYGECGSSNMHISSSDGLDKTVYFSSGQTSYTVTSQDGKSVTYNITFTDNFGGTSNYVLIIDKEAPYGKVVSGEETYEDYAATNKPFHIEIAEAGVTVMYSLNGGGYSIYSAGRVLSTEGLYQFTLIDPLGNTSEIVVLLDMFAPVLNVNAEVFERNEISVKEITVTEDNFQDVETSYYKNFEITSIADRDSLVTVAISHDGVVVRYSIDENIPALNVGGEYIIRVYDSVGNEYTFTVYIAGNEPEIMFADAQDGLSFSVAVSIELSFEYITSLKIYRDGDIVPEVSAETLKYAFVKDGVYTVVARDYLGRTVEKRYTFRKPAPYGVFTGVKNGGRTAGSVKFTFDGEMFIAEFYKNGILISTDDSGQILANTEGKYEIKLIYAVDEDRSRTYTFEIDNTAPVIFLSGCENGGITSGSVRVTWNDTDVAYSVYTVNGGKTISFTNGAVFSVGGYYVLTVTDTLNNASTVAFTIDKSLEYGVLVNGTLQTDISSTSGTVTIVDYEPMEISVTRNGEKISYVFGQELSEEGTYFFEVSDSLGNSENFTIIIDKSVALYATTGNGVITNNDVVITAGEAVTLTVKKDGKNYEYALGTALTQDGAYDVTAQDAFGNVKTLSFRIIKGPKTSFDYTLGDGVEIISVLKDGVEICVEGKVLNFTQDGVYSVICLSEGDRYSFELKVDLTAPVIMLEGCDNGGITRGSVTARWIDTDVKSAVYTRNGGNSSSFENGMVFTVEGSYVLTVSDNLDNASTVTFIIDKTAPVLSVRGEVCGEAYQRNWTVTKNNSADVKSVYFMSFAIESITDADELVSVTVTHNGKAQTYNGTIPEFKIGGEYLLSVSDSLNNGYSFTVYLAGSEPTVEFKVAADSSSINITITLEQSFEKLISLEIYRDGKALSGVSKNVLSYMFVKNGTYKVIARDNLWRTVEKSYTFVKPLPGGELKGVEERGRTGGAVEFVFEEELYYAEIIKNDEIISTHDSGEILISDEGSYEIKLYYLNDEESYIVYSFEISTEPPVITLKGCEDGKTTNGKVSVSWDDINVVSAVYSLNGASAAEFESGTEFTAEGEYVLTITDDVNNSTTVSFLIDTTAPTISLCGTENGGESSSPVTLTGLSEEGTVEVYKDGELIEYSFGDEITESGSYEVRVRDAVGNERVYTFTIAHKSSVAVVAAIAAAVVCVTGGITAAVAVFFVRRKRSIS